MVAATLFLQYLYSVIRSETWFKFEFNREVVSFKFIYYFAKFGEFWTTGRLCFVFFMFEVFGETWINWKIL
jgi:hypothetical protein